MTNLAGVYSEVAAYEFTTLTTVPGNPCDVVIISIAISLPKVLRDNVNIFFTYITQNTIWWEFIAKRKICK